MIELIRVVCAFTAGLCTASFLLLMKGYIARRLESNPKPNREDTPSETE
jgi:hypothetical protein